jgi:hypothetical protein
MGIWTEFHRLNSQLSSDSFTSVEISVFEENVKSWRSKFLAVYQSKNVTPYMHAFVAHVPEFLGIHGAIVPYTQQGLEKLNDSLTLWGVFIEKLKRSRKCFKKPTVSLTCLRMAVREPSNSKYVLLVINKVTIDEPVPPYTLTWKLNRRINHAIRVFFVQWTMVTTRKKAIIL